MIDAKSIKAIVNKFMQEEGVRGVIICDGEGLPIQSSFKGEQIERTEEISAYITSLIGRAKQTCEVLGEGSLNFVRLETSKGEVMIAPQEGLILIVMRASISSY
jgi:predicted regulator of Ras-like GTPase activity (Roadblock/LC7/MglB family)